MINKFICYYINFFLLYMTINTYYFSQRRIIACRFWGTSKICQCRQTKSTLKMWDCDHCQNFNTLQFSQSHSDSCSLFRHYMTSSQFVFLVEQKSWISKYLKHIPFYGRSVTNPRSGVFERSILCSRTRFWCLVLDFFYPVTALKFER